MTTLRQPWQDAWQQALYGADGFYRRQAPSAHFATSAQGIPGGGALLAEAVAALALRHRCERVIDLGAGRGELLHQLARLRAGLHLTGVDVVPRPPGAEVDDWLISPGGAQLPEGLGPLRGTLVVAHEWLDVVPAAVVERDAPEGPWRSVLVGPDGSETTSEIVPDGDLDWLGQWVPREVRRAEVGRARDLAWRDLLGRVESGVVVAVDYGHTRDDRPRLGTLTGFQNGREVAPVPDGSCDLTAHVAVDSLVAATPQPPTGPAWSAALLPQREALLDLLEDDPATPVPHHLARSQPAAYLRALARRAALQALTARSGSSCLGDFSWVVAVRG